MPGRRARRLVLAALLTLLFATTAAANAERGPSLELVNHQLVEAGGHLLDYAILDPDDDLHVRCSGERMVNFTLEPDADAARYQVKEARLVPESPLPYVAHLYLQGAAHHDTGRITCRYGTTLSF